MNGIIIHINGWPGVGKYTVGEIVARRLGAHFVPNHSVCGPAFCVTDLGTPAFFEIVRQVRSVVFEQIVRAPKHESFVLTSVLTEGKDDAVRFQTMRGIAAQRGCPFLAVTLTCQIEANLKRLNAPGRADRNSLINAAALQSLRTKHVLLRPTHDPALELDTSEALPEENAEEIIQLAKGLVG